MSPEPHNGVLMCSGLACGSRSHYNLKMGDLLRAIRRSLNRVLHLHLETAQPHLVDYLNNLDRRLRSLVNFVALCTNYGVAGMLFGIR